jgi:hypothetical protein
MVAGSGKPPILWSSQSPRLVLRLSPPSQKSAPHELKAGMEILIGTIRFQAHERTTLTEETILAEKEGGAVVAATATVTGGKSSAQESK